MDPKTLDVQNNFLNSANDSNLILKYFLNSEEKSIVSQNNEVKEIKKKEQLGQKQEISLEKILKLFRKNIKLRNATIKKNYWTRNYASTSPQILKISEFIPNIQASQGLILCINNYVHNDNYQELLCAIQTEKIYDSFPFVEKFLVINNTSNNEHNNNMLMNPKKQYDKTLIKNSIFKLTENVYKKIKKLKNELSQCDEPFIHNFISIQRIETETNSNITDIKCKLYTIFPNINFELKKIHNLSISSKAGLNSELILNKRKSKKHADRNLINGFLTMTNEKRIIALEDDTNNLKSSKAVREILFGIWINLRKEDVSLCKTEEEIIEKYKLLIYRKCLDFLFASSQIETIFSPSPDEGIFLLMLFLKGAQLFFEVKVLPNEEDKFFVNSNNQFQYNLENFGNQWLIMKRKFSLKNEVGFELDPNYHKVDTVVNFISKLTDPNYKSNNSNQRQQFTKSLSSGMSNNNNMNKFISSGTGIGQGPGIIKQQTSPFGFDPLPEIFESPAQNDFFNKLKSSLPINPTNSNSDKNDVILQTQQTNLKTSINLNINMNSSSKLRKSNSGGSYANINNNNNLLIQNLNEELTDRNDVMYDYPFSNMKSTINGTSNNQMNKYPQNAYENQGVPVFSQSISNYPSTNQNNQLGLSKQQSSSSIHKKVLSMINLNQDHQAMFSKNQKVTSSTPNNATGNNIIFAPVAKCDEGAQTEMSNTDFENNSINNNSQIQNLNMIISDQSHSIQMLQQKVNELEMLLNKVTTILKERENTCICKKKTQPVSMIENSNQNHLIENEFMVSDDDMEDKLSESLQKSKSDSNEQRIHLSKDISSNIGNTNQHINNRSSSILNISDSANEKTIEVPQIKYNSTMLSNDINESENY